MTAMEILKHVISVIIGFSSGVVISGAVFAFITIIGIVPRLAQKTRTQAHIKLYEGAIVAGGIGGTLAGFFKPHIPIGGVAVVVVSLCVGIFFGCLAMSLAEVLNVIPILSRRGRIQRGMFFFVLAIALGKMAGSLIYFIKPGFFDAGGM
jgi:stage V sporulation protein AB